MTKVPELNLPDYISKISEHADVRVVQTNSVLPEPHPLQISLWLMLVMAELKFKLVREIFV